MKLMIALGFLVVFMFMYAEACCVFDEKALECCGRGPCNIFCCNCDGGCKPKGVCPIRFDDVLDKIGYKKNTAKTWLIRLLENSDEENSRFAYDGRKDITEDLRAGRDAEKTFSLVDSDKNGFLCLAETRDYLETNGKIRNTREPEDAATPSWFTHMDSNGDGLISPNEFDHRL